MAGEMPTVILKGSPRQGGNSDTLADMFRAEAEGQGATVQEVKLPDLSYQGCINLFYCKTGGESCGQVDDLTPVLDAIAQRRFWCWPARFISPRFQGS